MEVARARDDISGGTEKKEKAKIIRADTTP